MLETEELRQLEKLNTASNGDSEEKIVFEKPSKKEPGQPSQKRGKKIRKKRWAPSHPWVPHPNQVTLKQCCQYLGLRDYPILVSENQKERFKDQRQFDDYATPLLKIANPAAHPLVLATLLRAKWFEVMNTQTGGLSYFSTTF